MKKLIILSLIAAVLGLWGQNASAQLNGLKEKAKKVPTGKKDLNNMSDACIRIKGEIDRQAEQARRYMDQGNFSSAASALDRMERRIEKYKDEPCPGVKNFQSDLDELTEEWQKGEITANADDYLLKGINEKDIELIKTSVELGADVNAKNYDKQAGQNVLPITAALATGDMAVVNLIIENGADINKRVKMSYGPDRSALNVAVANKNKAAVDLLLGKGADNNTGENVIYTAAETGDLEIFKSIIKAFKVKPYYAETDSKRRSYNSRYLLNTLCVAQKHNNSEIADYIVTEMQKDQLAKISDPVHKKHMNSFVLSHEPIAENSPNTSAFATTLNASKPIYGRLYLPAELTKMRFGKDGCETEWKAPHYKVHIKAEGVDKEWVMSYGDNYENHLSENTFALSVNTFKTQKYRFRRLFAALPEGETKAKVFVRFEDELEYEKDIVLVKNPGEMFITGRTFDDYQAGMQDADLAAKFLEAANKFETKKLVNTTFSDLKFKNTDWNIHRHNISGVILFRTLAAYCYGMTDEGFCVVQEVTLKQEYTGSGYSPVFIFYGSRFEEVADCK